MRPSSIAVLACLALSVACDNSGDSSTSPTQVLRTTDTITGTVQPMSAESHNFIVMQGGQVDDCVYGGYCRIEIKEPALSLNVHLKSASDPDGTVHLHPYKGDRKSVV